MRQSKLLQPLKAVWYQSWTKAWGYTKIISGSLLFSLSQLNTYISDPTLKGYLTELDLPKSVSLGLVVLGIITYLAHGHKDD